MSANVVNQVSYLKTTRQFPEEIPELVREINKAYVDIANTVNTRTIGISSVNRPAVTGESFFIQNNLRQQALRQVYVFTNTTAIPHGLNLVFIDRFTNNYGEFTDGTNWYGLISATNVAIAGQISFYLDSTNINFLVGAGAPALTKGIIVLQWLSYP